MNAHEAPWRPQIISPGVIWAEDGRLHISGWEFTDPSKPVGPIRLTGLDWFMGHSVKELHEMAHGAHCRCPVYGFTLINTDTGTQVLAYDEVPAYTGRTSEGERP